MAGSPNGTNIKEWYLSDLEIAFNLEKTPTTRSSSQAEEWKIYVPKIMPLIEKGLPKEFPLTLTDSMFINEASCKPVVQKKIEYRNYLMATRPANCAFCYEYKKHDMKFEVEVLHVNLDNLRVTNHIDNTVPE